MLKPIDIKEIPEPSNGKAPGPWATIVAEFISSRLNAAECETEQARSAYYGLYQFCKIRRLPVTVIKRGNRVFLIRKETANAE